MDRAQASTLSSCNDPFFSKVYGYLADVGKPRSFGDSDGLVLNTAQLDELVGIMGEEQLARYAMRGPVETPSQAYDKTLLKIAGDGVFNNEYGVGTFADPNVYTSSNIPLIISSYEATALYSSGGLPAQIIDKKSHGMVMGGATFRGFDEDFWREDKVAMLEESAETTGFNDVLSNTVMEAFVYGGSVIFPTFKHGSRVSDRTNLVTMEGVEKGCIARWDHVDRWNIVYVPNIIVTTKDYMRPKSIYIPQSCRDINSTHCSFIRPKPQPYWSLVTNMGWAPSDIVTWLREYYGYKITTMSLPIMAQQLSLILYRMPLDALNATIGVDKVRELMSVNEKSMTEWNSLSPKAVNMVGEVEVVDRTYNGLEQLVGAMKSSLSAACGIPEPILWHTPNKGFSDNTNESMLKQSEATRLVQSYVERALIPATDALIAHVFGTDSEEWQQRRRIRMTFNRTQSASDKDMAEMGARFAATIASFCQAGVSPDIAIKLAKPFFPNMKLTRELLDSVKESYDDVQTAQKSMGNMVGGPGGGLTKGVNKNTGKGTKPAGGE